MKLQELSRMLKLNHAVDDIEFDSISIDSRTLKPGQCYLALIGENFDGHDFVADAKQNGAVAAIVDRQCDVKIPQLIVPDTLQMLSDYAYYHRCQFNPYVVALTGSCGKTTVKEMVASIFSQAGKTFATRGNFNNHIGVPLSLLELNASYEYAVFELGASGAGEIAHTAQLVKPKVTLVNNVSAAHIAGFGTLNGVAVAKGEIYDALPDDGTAVVNIDDEFSNIWITKLGDKRLVTVSLNDETADIHAHSIVLHNNEPSRFTLVTPDDQAVINLPLPGKHNVRNALAAAAMAYASGCKIQHIVDGLANVKQVSGRMVLRQGKLGANVYDDSYNANPSSVKAAIDTLGTFPGKRVLILGEMAELGEDAPQYHREIGRYAKASGVDGLFTVGPLTAFAVEEFGENAKCFDNQEGLVDEVTSLLTEDVTCVVKGSRSAKMENIVNAICE